MNAGIIVVGMSSWAIAGRSTHGLEAGEVTAGLAELLALAGVEVAFEESADCWNVSCYSGSVITPFVTRQSCSVSCRPQQKHNGKTKPG